MGTRNRVELHHLNPATFTDQGQTFLQFDCPLCNDGHAIAVRIGPTSTRVDGYPVWKAEGQVPHLTLTPSIRVLPPGCRFHAWIRDGVVDWWQDP